MGSAQIGLLPARSLQSVKSENTQDIGLIAPYHGATTIDGGRYRFRIDPPSDDACGKIFLEDTCLRDQWECEFADIGAFGKPGSDVPTNVALGFIAVVLDNTKAAKATSLKFNSVRENPTLEVAFELKLEQFTWKLAYGFPMQETLESVCAQLEATQAKVTRLKAKITRTKRRKSRKVRG